MLIFTLNSRNMDEQTHVIDITCRYSIRIEQPCELGHSV